MAGAHGWGEADFAAALAAPQIVIAADAVSYALARHGGGEAELLLIATHPAARQAQHGTRALLRLEALLMARAVERIFLEVAEGNGAAIALYRRQGYRETGRRTGYYGAGAARQDALLMAKDLAPGP